MLSSIFFSYQLLLRVFILTISRPAILLLHNMSDEPFPRLCIHPCDAHTCIFIHCRGTITLINTALHGTELSDILMRLLAYMLIILFDFHFMRRIYLDFITEIKKGWGILSPDSMCADYPSRSTCFLSEHYSKRPHKCRG